MENKHRTITLGELLQFLIVTTTFWVVLVTGFAKHFPIFLIGFWVILCLGSLKIIISLKPFTANWSKYPALLIILELVTAGIIAIISTVVG
jgi:hypothetical protein